MTDAVISEHVLPILSVGGLARLSATSHEFMVITTKQLELRLKQVKKIFPKLSLQEFKLLIKNSGCSVEQLINMPIAREQALIQRGSKMLDFYDKDRFHMAMYTQNGRIALGEGLTTLTTEQKYFKLNHYLFQEMLSDRGLAALRENLINVEDVSQYFKAKFYFFKEILSDSGIAALRVRSITMPQIAECTMLSELQLLISQATTTPTLMN